MHRASFFSRLLSRPRRFKEIQNSRHYRFEFQKLIANISTHFIRLTVDQIHDGIHEAFERVCQFAGADRGYIFWYSDILGRHMEKIQEWCAPSIPSELVRVRELHMGMFPYFDGKIKELQPFLANRIKDLPAEASAERKEFSAQNVQSLIFVPMVYEGKSIGFIGFEMIRGEVIWNTDTISLLKLLSEIFVNALERIRADKVLRQSEERYSLIARGVNDGLWDWNLKTDTIFFTSRWKSMLGYEDNQISEQPSEWFDRIHPEDRIHVDQTIYEHLKGLSAHCEIEHRILHIDGNYRWVLIRGLAIKDEKGRVWRMAGSATDITTRIRFEEKLKHNALHDSLTGLPNRAFFLERLKDAANKAKKYPKHLFAVLFMDLNRFKAINDSFGHLVGDEFLIQVGRAIETCVGSGPLVARFGGDEFTILIEGIHDAGDAIAVAERIQETLKHPFSLQDQTIFTSASIGIALSSATDILDESDMLRNADTAMYGAKANDKGGYVIYTEVMHAKILATLRMETALRQALDRKELQIHYQPIISLQHGVIKGFEALLRWTHPELGSIPPSVFIPMAEETGLIIPIGLWVLNQACREAALWPRRGKNPLSVSINLSVKQFSDVNLVDQIKKILQETQLDPECLHLEITESVLVEDSAHAFDILSQLRELKVKLYLDDFGTGYSSLSYLHRFPLDILKIDRSFISTIGTDGETSEITKAILSLAHNMNLEVVAEGIETEEQLDFLRTLGCEYGQGYFFAKPLSSDQASNFVLNQ